MLMKVSSLRVGELFPNHLLSSAAGWVPNHNGHSPARNPTWGERGFVSLPSWEITRVLHLLRGGLGLGNVFLSFWKLLPLGDWQTGKLETVLKHWSCYGWLLWLRMFIFINCQLLVFLGWRLCNPTSGWLWPLECSQDAAFHSSRGNSRSLLCNMCSITKRRR